MRARTHRRDSVDRLDVPIRDVMSRNVVSVSAEVGIDTLEDLLLERDLSGVPVTDRDRRLVGYVAMTDIVRELHDRGDTGEAASDRMAWGYHIEPAPKAVSEVMAPVAFELQEASPISVAIELMTARHLHRVPVVSDDGVLVGIVSAGDVLRFLARRDADTDTEADVDDSRTAPLTEADRMVSLGFLASGLAHQVNNALTPMRLTLGRLTTFELSRRPLTDERMHRVELLQDMREGFDRIERIVRELRTFAHTDDVVSGPTAIGDQLDAAIALAAHEIRHRARLVRDYQPVPKVQARAAELRQVFLNLLINAVHAMPEAEAHVNEIAIKTWTDERGFAVTEIADTGTGIRPDTLPRIFEPFFTTQPGRALGLGLAVARDLVTSLCGHIAVDSVVGKGTRIRVALPPCDVVARGSAPSLEPPRDAPAAAKRLRVLIVDDDRPVAAAIALELAHHEVVVAESGREALDILERDKGFDVILCDLMMPEVSGMDVYEALRLIDPALVSRVVLMTGGAFTNRARDFLSSVDTPLLEKPFEAGDLHAIVHTLDRRDAGKGQLAP